MKLSYTLRLFLYLIICIAMGVFIALLLVMYG